MFDPRSDVFIVKGHVFSYLDGILSIQTGGDWNKHEPYDTYDEAVIAAKEIVDEFYAMRAYL
jgi:hypothetical protein|tara:strand:+ start:1210 stop:1395 length:186 start_codon:yes stop_codon:yes gene_type:complete